MKKLIKSFVSFLKDSFLFLIFLLEITKKGNWFHRFPLQKKNGKTLTLLANAPSLKDVLPRLSTDEEFQNTDFIVLNFFANTPEFFQIKPTHYCFADSMFFKKTHNYEKVMLLFELIENKVDWNINIYIPKDREKEFQKFSGLTNPCLRIIPVNSTIYKGYGRFRYWFYRIGVSSPIYSTVAILGIYVGINLGYKQIRLYGVDHTFFHGLCVNNLNQVCMEEVHFYETESTKKPIVRNDNDQIWRMSDYINAISMMFRSHDDLADYAKTVGSDIVNCTDCSLIDSYPRLSK